MTHHLKLIKGGEQTQAAGVPAVSHTPDHTLFALVDEARILETKDRLFNRQIEQVIEESDAWMSGDRQAALNATAVCALREEHRPVIERLLELPGEIAATPADTWKGVIVKLRYLATLLEADELDILESAIEDIEYLG